LWVNCNTIQPEEDSFHLQLGLSVDEETIEMLHLEHNLSVVLQLDHLGKQIGNTWKVLKYGAGEGWRSAGPIV
jgi:hypothetical protein